MKDAEQRVLVCAPTGRDGQLARDTLVRAGLQATEAAPGAPLRDAIAAGAGCVLLTDEALARDGLPHLLEALEHQPAWSDLPVMVLTAPAAGAGPVQVPERLLQVANVTLFERPVRMDTLIAAVRAGLRARARQYAAREVLERVQTQADELRRAADERQRLLESERSARRVAEEATRAKDEFLAVVSHELRTPLSAILGWTSLLRSGRQAPDRVGHAVEVIERNAKSQARLIEDLLDVSKIITGKLKLEVQLLTAEQFVGPAVETVRLAAAARGVHLEVILDPEPCEARGDAARLQQVVWNLLHNAIKFSRPGGHVSLRVTSTANDLQVRVTDDGRGIASEFLPFVFDRFRQAEAPTTRSTGGLGLGLAICRHVVELHGGSIEAASDGVGRGATFTVRLPRSAPEPSTVAARARPRTAPVVSLAELPDLRGVRVLLVDDDDDTREYLRAGMERCAAEVIEAANAREAISLVESAAPSILVSDIGMPGEDGLALMRRLRGLATAAAATPAIALTAFARNEDRDAALAAGFQLHLPKPIELDALATAILSLSRRSA